MSDSYDAIYAAVSNRITGGNIGDVVERVAREMFDISWAKAGVADELQRAALSYQRPSAVYRPTLTIDGNAWVAVYGDFPSGVVGTGPSPNEAMEDFDAAWYRRTEPKPTAGEEQA